MNAVQRGRLWDLAQTAYSTGNERAGERLQSIATGLGSDAVQRCYVAMKDPTMKDYMIKAVELLFKR